MSAENPILIQSDDEEAECLQGVTDCFPDICPDYLRRKANAYNYDARKTISAILDAMASGEPYDRRAKRKELKRKRNSSSSDIEAKTRKMQLKYNSSTMPAKDMSWAEGQARQVFLFREFPRIPWKTIRHHLEVNKNQLFPTYMALFETVYKNHPELLKWEPWDQKETLHNSPLGLDDHGALDEECQSARSICIAKKRKFMAEKDQKNAEEKNFAYASSLGQIAECGCCFDYFALNRLVHCDGEPSHFYCSDCMRRHTEHQIGLARYELKCISIDGCSAGFSAAARSKFLTDDLVATLERIETESILRAADIQDLVMCPFCPYAAICPPAEVDKEFRCANPECEIVSCRHCQAETHLPAYCEDAAGKSASTARRALEEAMSAALIRKCNKCGTAFIKSFGCNKMTCPRAGCLNVQCYVCSVSCGYEHFKKNSNSKEGTCPLYDSGFDRHEVEVREAEVKAKEQIIKDNPGIRPEHLDMQTPKVAPQRAQIEHGLPRLQDLVGEQGVLFLNRHIERNHDDHDGRRTSPPVLEPIPLTWRMMAEAPGAWKAQTAQQLAAFRPLLPTETVDPRHLFHMFGRADSEQRRTQQDQAGAVEKQGRQRVIADPEDVSPDQLEKLATFRIPPPLPPIRILRRPKERGFDHLFGPNAVSGPNFGNELPGGHNQESDGSD